MELPPHSAGLSIHKSEYTLKMYEEKEQGCNISRQPADWQPGMGGTIMQCASCCGHSRLQLCRVRTLDRSLFRPLLLIFLMTFLPLCVFSLSIIFVNIEHTLGSHLRYFVNSGESVLRQCLPRSMYPTLRLVR